MLQDGAYRRLMDEYYVTEKPLPKDRDLLYARLRAVTAEERWAVDGMLAEFFKETKSGFVNKRAKEEIQRANLRAKSARVNGLTGGRPKAHSVPSGFHSANRIESSPDSRLQTLDSIEKKEKERSALPLPKLTEVETFARKSFERFWEAYPNQLDRDVCFQIWQLLSPIDQDKAAESVPAWAKSEAWAEARFVPKPETFIRKRRWESRPPALQAVNLADRKRELEAKFESA